MIDLLIKFFKKLFIYFGIIIFKLIDICILILYRAHNEYFYHGNSRLSWFKSTDFYIKGISVSGCDNLVGGDLDNISSKVNFVKADCENLNKMKELTKNIDVVIHAAAYAHEGLSVVSPNIICSNIVNASTAVFSAAIQTK